jgi:DNA-binding NtrC family response regulator
VLEVFALAALGLSTLKCVQIQGRYGLMLEITRLSAPEMLPETLRTGSEMARANRIARGGNGARDGYRHEVQTARRRIVLTALADAGGSYSDAADALRVNRTYLHRLVNALGIRRVVADLFKPNSPVRPGSVQ